MTKHRKLNHGQRGGIASKIKVVEIAKEIKNDVSLMTLSWDCLEVIVDFLPLNDVDESFGNGGRDGMKLY